MKNTAKIYCYEKVAQPTSALYYSLRGLKPAKRDQVVAIHAFYREIEDIIFECQEVELALVKLNWWRGEVAKLGLAKAEHPVMIMMQECIPNLEPTQDRLLKIIDGMEQVFIPEGFATFEDVVIHWMQTAGERELLLNDEIVPAEMIYRLMLIIKIADYLQYLHRYIQRGIIYFPADEMQQFGVTTAMLNELVTTDEIKKLLQHQVEKVERAYLGIAELSDKQRKALSHLIIRCEMARATLREIAQSDFKVLENLIVLTPLRYWWIAWRL